MIFSDLLKNSYFASFVFNLFYQSLILFFAGWVIIKIFFMVFAFAASLILARQSWTFYSKQSPLKTIPLPELMHPELISADSNQLIIQDEISICAYSLSDFSLVTKFGKKGQGPGEFRLPPMVHVFPDEFVISLMTKVWRFSRDGDLIEETKLPFNYFGLDYSLLPVGENYVGFPNEQWQN